MKGCDRRSPNYWRRSKWRRQSRAARRWVGIATELETAVAVSPSPQQVEMLQDGFERLTRLWSAAKSGLF